MFERVLMEPSQVTELGRIPGSLLKLLPAETQKQVEARRASEQRRAQAKTRRAHAQIARSGAAQASSAAAAIAPGGNYIGGFEVDEIVARMRAPRTAADPGVPDWRASRVRGGTAYTAQVGRTQYEVGPERVAFTASPARFTRRSARVGAPRDGAPQRRDLRREGRGGDRSDDGPRRARRCRSFGQDELRAAGGGPDDPDRAPVDTGVFVYSIHP